MSPPTRLSWERAGRIADALPADDPGADAGNDIVFLGRAN